MAYSILVRYKDKTLREIPFSTHRNFHDLLLPLAQKMELKLLSDVGFGIVLNTKEELILFIKELEAIQSSGLLNNDDRYNTDRLQFLIQELTDITGQNNVEFVDVG